MQREIIFDPLTAGAVSELLASMAEMEKTYNAKKNELTAIMLTAARMSGCVPEDVVRLNEIGTGVVVESLEAVEPGEAESGDLKLPRMENPPSPPPKKKLAVIE